MPVPEGDFHVDTWLVRPPLNALEAGTRTVRVEPRVMQVLVCLAACAGDVVSKESLVSAVWGDTCVSDDALTNSIWELRRALGDDARKPRFIQTVAKRGYRLIAPVRRNGGALRPTRRGWGPDAAADVPPVAPRPQPYSPRIWVPLIVAAVFFAAATVHFLDRPLLPPAQAVPARASIAVLYFENLTGDPSLDWLRTAIMELLVGDLARSSRLRVLSTDRIHQILEETRGRKGRSTSLDAVSEVASRTSVGTVVVGNFARSGDTLRLAARLEDARSGEILASESVEGEGLLPLVDELARRLKARLEIWETTEARLDRDLKDVTTSSLAAFRLYAQGLHKYTFEHDNDDAVRLLEEAVALDPDFALALSKLAVFYTNAGEVEKADDAARRAFDRRERLTARERYYVEGNFWSRREETVDRAIRAYETALRLFPDHIPARHNLAAVLFQLERYDEAIVHLEELRRSGASFSGSYAFLASAYAAQGKFEEGYRAAEAFIQMRPEDWTGYRSLAHHLVRWGKLDEAQKAFLKAESVASEEVDLRAERWPIAFLREEWKYSPEARRATSSNDDPLWRSCSLHRKPLRLLYDGETETALSVLRERSAGTYADTAAILSAQVLLARGLPEKALDEARRVRKARPGTLYAWTGLYYQSLAEAQLGRHEEARKTAGELKRVAELLPSSREVRRYHALSGELALLRGDHALAIHELERAESLLPPRGYALRSNPPQQVPIWYGLASAHLAAGQVEEAARFYLKVAESGSEHIQWPIPYVRSFYFLGHVHELRGDSKRAKAYYGRFLSYWRTADIDRDRVNEALDLAGEAPLTEAVPERPSPLRKPST